MKTTPFCEPLPVAAATRIAAALDALHRADAALQVAFDALARTDLEAQGSIGSYHVIAYRATVKLLTEVFASCPASLGLRQLVPPGCYSAVLGSIDAVADGAGVGVDEGEGDTPGLRRAAVALRFADVWFEEAADVLDKSGGGDAWHHRCVAASSVLEDIVSALECNRARRPNGGGLFGSN